MEELDTEEKILKLVEQSLELYRQGKYGEAISCYDNIIKLDPEYGDAHYNKGIALFDQGLFEESNKCYDQIIKIDPTHKEVWLNKGVNLFMLGKY